MQLNQRKPPIRSPKMLEAAQGHTCVLCGRNDGTVVAAHYQGIGSARLGKGRGQKPSDLHVADLCHRCHQAMDAYEGGNDPERSLDFCLAILETLERRWRDGVIGDGRNAA